MNTPTIIQQWVRGVGLFFGMVGIALPLHCWFFFGPRELPLLFAALFVALFFLLSAWLAWFHWSRFALRQVVANAAFVITIGSAMVIASGPAIPSAGPIAFLVAVPICYILYQWTTHELNRRAFPKSPAPPPLPQARPEAPHVEIQERLKRLRPPSEPPSVGED
jgi:hypothetical protein